MIDPLDGLVQFMLDRHLDDAVDETLSSVNDYDQCRVALYRHCQALGWTDRDGLDPGWLPTL